MKGKTRIGIIGSGETLRYSMEAIRENHSVIIAGVADVSGGGGGIAKKLGAQIYDDYRKLVENDDIDLFIDLTADEGVESHIIKQGAQARLMPKLGAWLIWKLMEENKLFLKETARHISEQQVLYSAGVMLASAANTQQTLDLIMESALNIIDMSAGALAFFDEEQGAMKIKASIGFDGGVLETGSQWRIRQGGLTGRILSSSSPTVIEDLDKVTEFDTSEIKKLGVKSLIATPLRISGKIVGILYVDEFKAKNISEREVNILSLLALQAAAAIEKATLLEKAELLAVNDGLTNLYNHRFLGRALEKEVRRAQRYTSPLALIMVDVDYFRAFNDTHGHIQGNVILTTLAEILKRSARESDIVARWGGEEFALILTETPRDKAEMVAKRIRAEVEETYFPGQESQPQGKLTVSLGVATFPEDAQEPLELIEKADTSLYRSKELGRNIVTMYDKRWDVNK